MVNVGKLGFAERYRSTMFHATFPPPRPELPCRGGDTGPSSLHSHPLAPTRTACRTPPPLPRPGQRAFTVPRSWAGQRVRLHFGVVDHEATVRVNGTRVTTHRGGYDRFEVDITPQLRAGSNELIVRAEALSGATVVGEATGGFGEFSVPAPNARRWSPDDPFLYDLRVTLRTASGAAVDTVTSCFGMRDVGKKTVDAVLRPTLNGEFACQIGTLDQGYWPDGRFFAYEQVFSNAQLNDRSSPDLGRQGASYRTVAGLADPRCPSFESVNLPGSFLRHYDSAVYIASGDGGSGFNPPQTLTADSSWPLAAPWAP
ncbi:AbfB domain-containing protein [Streptomyces bacillaris]|uniref:AbfB domain-containing protein n=1 Tax=Streptomyces bacillaris TaxID=68179 RepID=UPI003696D9F4